MEEGGQSEDVFMSIQDFRRYLIETCGMTPAEADLFILRIPSEDETQH